MVVAETGVSKTLIFAHVSSGRLLPSVCVYSLEGGVGGGWWGGSVLSCTQTCAVALVRRRKEQKTRLVKQAQTEVEQRQNGAGRSLDPPTQPASHGCWLAGWLGAGRCRCEEKAVFLQQFTRLESRHTHTHTLPLSTPNLFRIPTFQTLDGGGKEKLICSASVNQRLLREVTPSKQTRGVPPSPPPPLPSPARPYGVVTLTLGVGDTNVPTLIISNPR